MRRSSNVMRPADPAEARELLSGSVERVTFHNEENGFAVLRVHVSGHRDLVTVVGHMATVSPGEAIQAGGAWMQDRTHGLQFKAAWLRAAAPTSLEGIEKYLASGLLKGIGPHFAKRLVAAFGADVFNVIEQEPSRLRDVEGIGPLRATRITEGWSSQRAVREIMVFLHSARRRHRRARCASTRPMAPMRSRSSARIRIGWRATSAASVSSPPTRSPSASASRKPR